MTHRYLVADVPTVGPDKGKITKVWDFDLTLADAELLKRRIANRRMSKWPVVLDQEADANHPHVEPERAGFPTPAEMAVLGIKKVFDGGPRTVAPVSSTPAPAPYGWSEEQRETAAKSAAAGAVAAATAVTPAPTPPSEPPPDVFGPTLITISVGWMGDPAKWCWTFTEYQDEGSFGPFDSEEEVRAAVAKELGEMPYEIDVVVREMKTTAPFREVVVVNPDAPATAEIVSASPETTRHPIDR